MLQHETLATEEKKTSHELLMMDVGFLYEMDAKAVCNGETNDVSILLYCIRLMITVAYLLLLAIYNRQNVHDGR